MLDNEAKEKILKKFEPEVVNEIPFVLTKTGEDLVPSHSMVLSALLRLDNPVID